MKSSEHWNWCFFISYQLSVVSCHRQTAEAERNVWFVRQQLQRSVRVFNGICAGVDFTGGWRCCCCSCFSSSTVRNALKSECRLFALTAGWWSCLLQGLYAHQKHGSLESFGEKMETWLTGPCVKKFDMVCNPLCVSSAHTSCWPTYTETALSKPCSAVTWLFVLQLFKQILCPVWADCLVL